MVWLSLLVSVLEILIPWLLKRHTAGGLGPMEKHTANRAVGLVEQFHAQATLMGCRAVDVPPAPPEDVPQ